MWSKWKMRTLFFRKVICIALWGLSICLLVGFIWKKKKNNKKNDIFINTYMVYEERRKKCWQQHWNKSYYSTIHFTLNDISLQKNCIDMCLEQYIFHVNLFHYRLKQISLTANIHNRIVVYTSSYRITVHSKLYKWSYNSLCPVHTHAHALHW
jgi:hypothetical protein